MAAPDFAVSLLLTVKRFPFAQAVQDNILRVLEDKFAGHPVTVDTRARLVLEKVLGEIEVNGCSMVYLYCT